MVAKMADIFSSFNNTVNTVTYGYGGTRSNPVSGRFAKDNSAPATVTVKDATGTGVFGFLSGIFNSEKHVSVEPQGSSRASVTVKDYTGASAGQILTGNVPEQRYNTTKVGDNVVVEKAPSAGDSWWKILTGR